MPRHVARLTVMCLALIAGCSKSHDTDQGSDNRDKARDAGQREPADAGGAVVDEDGLCARLAAIQCDGEQKCCSKQTRSRARCLTELTRSCADSLYLDQIAAAPQSGFDEAAANGAFEALALRVSDCDQGVLQWIASDEGLRTMFRGTRAAGASCSPVGGASGDPGTVAAAIASCRGADGLACLPASLIGAWTCAPRQASGRSCLTDDNCADHGACNNFSQPALGMCVARRQLGAACANAGECESLECRGGKCVEPTPDSVYCPMP